MSIDVERLERALATYYGKDTSGGHIVPFRLRDKFGLPYIWDVLAEGIAAEYERLPPKSDDASSPEHMEGE